MIISETKVLPLPKDLFIVLHMKSVIQEKSIIQFY